MASAMPSSSRHRRAASGASLSVRTNPAPEAATRSTKRRTAGYVNASRALMWSSSGGQASGCSLKTNSPSARSGSRLVTSTCSCGQPRASASAIRAMTATMCSQPSRTTRPRRSARCLTRAASSSSRFCSPTIEATDEHASSIVVAADRSTKWTSPSNVVVAACADAIASVVLPMPPEPTSETKRCCDRLATSAAISSLRPTIAGPSAGRLLA